MNENLEKQLSKVVEKAIEAAEKTGEFVVEQAPDLLREFYTWHTISHTIGLCISLALFIGVLFWIKYLVRNWKDIYHRDLEVVHIAGIVVVGVLTLVTTLIQGFCLIKILVAPKLYLIEYFI